MEKQRRRGRTSGLDSSSACPAPPIPVPPRRARIRILGFGALTPIFRVKLAPPFLSGVPLLSLSLQTSTGTCA